MRVTKSVTLIEAVVKPLPNIYDLFCSKALSNSCSNLKYDTISLVITNNCI